MKGGKKKLINKLTLTVYLSKKNPKARKSTEFRNQAHIPRNNPRTEMLDISSH